jgi:hypothetical protein
VAQGIGPEFKPQYHTHTHKEEIKEFLESSENENTTYWNL